MSCIIKKEKKREFHAHPEINPRTLTLPNKTGLNFLQLQKHKARYTLTDTPTDPTEKEFC